MPIELTIPTLFAIFCIQLLGVFFISRTSINSFFELLHRIFRHDTVVYSIVALFLLPGTTIHELSHFFMAIILFLRVRAISVFPSWQKGYIKLGYVLYEKKDPVRGFLVGIAPIFVGLLFFILLAWIHILPSSNIWINIAGVYVIFIISSTMFSSKQDVVDALYTVPFMVLAGIIVYLFQINIYAVLVNQYSELYISSFLFTINSYLFISLCVHICIIILIRLLIRFLK